MISAAPPVAVDWRRFFIAACAVAVACIGFIAWMTLRLDGEQTTQAVDNIGQGLASAVAGVACFLAARRSKSGLRRAWAFISASAFSFACGQVVFTIYVVGMKVAPPAPSVADIGYLAAIVFTIAGVMSFANTSRGTSMGLRLWLDRASVALSLLFLFWVSGLSGALNGPPQFWAATAIAIIYPIGLVLILTVLILTIRRATDEQQGRLILVLGGVAATSIASGAFAILSANGTSFVNGSVLDAGWVVGFLMIALAAQWPSGMRDRTNEGKPVDMWQLVLPWIPILAGGCVAVVQALRGHPLDQFATLLAGSVIALVMVGQVLAQRDSLSLVYRSRQSAATLNDVIVNAPLGVVRIASDMTILQANPRFGALLRASAEELTGAPIDQFLPLVEIGHVVGELKTLSNRDVAAKDFDTEARRTDGSSVWLHWSSTAVHRTSGDVDYFVVMVEDVSARRAAAAAAAANFEVLQRLNKVKSQFITKVRHEFRTALVGIQGFSEYISESGELDPAEVKAMAHDIYAGARKLERTIDEMLVLDRSESEATALKVHDVDLVDLLKETAAAVQMGAPNQSIDVNAKALPHVLADTDMLAQVVTSLLGRAIDYSPPGAHITINAVRLKDDVRVSVANEGKAVPSDLEVQLLGRTDRAQGQRQARALSGDVGLPMARQIVEMHGGRIWFEAGESTVWHFTVPVAVEMSALPVAL